MHGVLTFPTVVGYQNFDVGANVSKLTASSFLKISGARTLVDLKLVSRDSTKFNTGNNNIKFYDSIGNQLKVANDTWITTKYPATLTDRYTKTATVVFGYDETRAHWYLASDSGYKYIMDDYPLVDGAGFLILAGPAHTQGIDLVYNGQVGDEDTKVDVGSNVSKLTANVSPAPTTLKEIALNSIDGTKFNTGNINIKFYDSIGNQLKVANDTWITTKYPATLTDRYTKTASVVFGYDETRAHWYLASDSGYKYIMDDYPIAAAAGFLVQAGPAHVQGIQVILPPAIEKTDK